MTHIRHKKGTIAILTGGGDVPGLNPAIRAITLRALQEGYQVLGLKRGWAGLLELIPDKDADSSDKYVILTEEIVNRAGRTGGTFLHTSRTNPGKIPFESVPDHLKDKYNQKENDLTPVIVANLDFLGVDFLIPIGGDDTLSYSVRLYEEGVKVIAIPKTMDNDVPGTDYCIGFSTCITRTINMTNTLRTSAGSHERILVVEIFGRYAGLQPCCQQWQERQTVVLFPNINSISKNLPNCSWKTATGQRAGIQLFWFRKELLSREWMK